ncbi:hypothetical protein KDAU_42830 [Dictyobacter aurantiacus]|uniref:Uncharacterized protein n=1 Tax=Dictyobacter aurantiacus TaxID=1936993 RepID=A0A401ZJF0_9CHLR|nr:hypothetical protein KDAU_42830 [Dictyobacter aurantiacus]
MQIRVQGGAGNQFTLDVQHSGSTTATPLATFGADDTTKLTIGEAIVRLEANDVLTVVNTSSGEVTLPENIGGSNPTINASVELWKLSS